MRKLLLIITILILFIAASTVHYFAFDVKIVGDLEVDSLLKLPGITTGEADTFLIRDNDTIYYRVIRVNGDTLFWGNDTLITGGAAVQDSTWVQAWINTLGSAGTHTENAYIDTIPIGTVFPVDIEVDGGWQTWTPTLTWTTSDPTINATVARYNRVNNKIQYLVYINFTTGGTPPTALNVTLPTAPKDIDVPIVPVEFVSRTGTTYSKGQYPYIEAASGTVGDRKLYVPTFSIVATTQYGWSFSGTYEIE